MEQLGWWLPVATLQCPFSPGPAGCSTHAQCLTSPDNPTDRTHHPPTRCAGLSASYTTLPYFLIPKHIEQTDMATSTPAIVRLSKSPFHAASDVKICNAHPWNTLSRHRNTLVVGKRRTRRPCASFPLLFDCHWSTQLLTKEQRPQVENKKSTSSLIRRLLWWTL